MHQASQNSRHVSVRIHTIFREQIEHLKHLRLASLSKSSLKILLSGWRAVEFTSSSGEYMNTKKHLRKLVWIFKSSLKALLSRWRTVEMCINCWCEYGAGCHHRLRQEIQRTWLRNHHNIGNDSIILDEASTRLTKHNKPRHLCFHLCFLAQSNNFYLLPLFLKMSEYWPLACKSAIQNCNKPAAVLCFLNSRPNDSPAKIVVRV
jgi:hypothetical protein